MSDPVWVGQRVVLAMHERLLAEHGGAAGVRDPGMLDSALARPKNLVAYGTPDPADLAAAYVAGIIKNHPFVDGNKRTAFMTGYVFLASNGHSLTASEAEAAATTLALAAGEIGEAEFAAWLRANFAARR